MGPSLDGSRQLDGAQPPPITTRHIPLHSPCLCKSNAANHASTGRELVESLCIMGPGLDGSRQLDGAQPPAITTRDTQLDSPCLRSEERRVGKESRSRLAKNLYKKRNRLDGSSKADG